MIPLLPFPDRTAAGTVLGLELQAYQDKPDTVILGLVRGGIVVGRAMANILHLPLYPFIVRKIGHPWHREYALGALAEGGATWMDDEAVRASGATWEEIEAVIAEEKTELERRRHVYLADARPPLMGKTVILTDDGAATGSTLFAAMEALRAAKVSTIILALPVCPPDTAAKLREMADATVILATPANFEAVGKWYRRFDQVEDAEVLRLLAEEAKMPA